MIATNNQAKSFTGFNALSVIKTSSQSLLSKLIIGKTAYKKSAEFSKRVARLDAQINNLKYSV